ncbi:MAG: hypothetical protein K2Q12_00030, partial [Rickettsiales bacterium]|nr:hypothetical protein [Rickettsiales bacterium]
MAYSGITKHKRSFVDAMIEDHIRMDIRRYAYPNHLIGAVHAVLTDRPFARSAKMLSKEILKDFPALAYPYPLHPRPLHPLAFENVLQDAVMRATESLLLASSYQKLKDGAAALLANNEEVNEKLHHA